MNASRNLSGHSVYVPDILRRLADTEFATQEGTSYPLLSKLRREGLVHYEWRESETGPPRKYYQLTESGRAQVHALDQYWLQLHRTVRYDWLSQSIFGSIQAVQDAATRWLWTYNNERPNMALGGITPRQKLAMTA